MGRRETHGEKSIDTSRISEMIANAPYRLDVPAEEIATAAGIDGSTFSRIARGCTTLTAPSVYGGICYAAGLDPVTGEEMDLSTYTPDPSILLERTQTLLSGLDEVDRQNRQAREETDREIKQLKRRLRRLETEKRAISLAREFSLNTIQLLESPIDIT